LPFTSQLPDGNENLPVLMWIHGGGYRRGSASQYGVRHLVNKELVVVTIQYRLGSLGEAYCKWNDRNERGEREIEIMISFVVLCLTLEDKMWRTTNCTLSFLELR
jgi:carboxylesterase type B